MKKLLIIFLVLFTLNIKADPLHDACKSVQDLAEVIMEKRQAGMNISSMMEVVIDENDPEIMNNLHKEMILDAYNTSLYSTSLYIIRVVNEFKNTWYLNCIVELKEIILK